jgi:hypothetical protein
MATPQEIIQQTIDSVFAAIGPLTFEEKREVMMGLSLAAQKQVIMLNQAEQEAQVVFAAANRSAFAVVRDAEFARKLAGVPPPAPVVDPKGG